MMKYKVIVLVLLSISFTQGRRIDIDDHYNLILKVKQNLTNVGRICTDDISRSYKNNTSIHEYWSTFNSEYKYGNSHDFGNFSGCKSISPHLMNVQYCLVQYYNTETETIPVPVDSVPLTPLKELDISFMGALCLPSSCSTNDVIEIMKMTLSGYDLRLGKDIHCRLDINADIGWNWSRIIFFSCLTALSTALMSIDIPFMKFTTIVKDFINLTSKNINTNYLNGIKTISLVSIFAVHSWGLRFFFLFKDGENSKNYQTNFAAIAFLFGTIVMDLFFIIGGYLTTRGLKRLYNEGKETNWIPKFYIVRLMRLFPVVILIVGHILTSKPGYSGPIDFPDEKENCMNNLIGILGLNLIDVDYIFAPFIWYTSTFFQLTLTSPFIFMAINSKKFSQNFTFIIITLSVFFRSSELVEAFPIFLEIYETNMRYGKNNFLIFKHYSSVLMRFAPFCFGMIIEQFMDKKWKDLKVVSLILKSKLDILLTVFLPLLVLIDPLPVAGAIADIFLVILLTFVIRNLYFSTGRIKNFLSHNFWTPISKLSLSFYLLSCYMQTIMFRHQMEPLEIRSFLQIIQNVLWDFSYITIPILASYIFIEEPFGRLGLAIAMFSRYRLRDRDLIGNSEAGQSRDPKKFRDRPESMLTGKTSCK